MTSGIHGAEGPVGSAVQRYFMDAVLPRTELDEMSVLLVHALNPFGFRHMRRVTERDHQRHAQPFHHGHASPADEAEVRRRFGEMFYPSSPRWRTQVMATTRDLWPVILGRFASL